MTQVDHPPRFGPFRFFGELREGARRQGNVIFALIFRELKARAGPDGYGLLSFVGIMLEPIIAVAAMVMFFYLVRYEEISGVHVALFVAVSYTPFMLFRRCLTSVPKSLQSNRALFAFQSVKPFDAVLARYLIELVLTMIGTFGLLFLLWWFLDLTILTDRLLHALGLIIALLLGSFGLGLFLAVYGARFPVIFKVITLFGRGMVFLSAVIHPVRDLPTKALVVLEWNPIVHFEELLRYYLLGLPPFRAASVEYFLGFVMVTLFLGFAGYYTNRLKVLER